MNAAQDVRQSASSVALPDRANRNVRCRVCGSEDISDAGPPRYRRKTSVAGVPIDVSDLGLRHYRCRHCRYQFVSPPIPAERLLACYAAAAATHWGTDPALAANRAYSRKRALLERFAPGRRILDFGCYDGGFLEFLGDTWDRAGIEPSAAAVEVARGRGVRVIAPTVEAVDPNRVEPFDAIVAFDVIEHLTDPVGTLAALKRVLRPGGIVLIETGNTDAGQWRLFGSGYWYCGVVEHVGFFNKSSIREAGARAGLTLKHFERSTHYRFPLQLVWRATLTFWAYCALRSLKAVRVPLPDGLDEVAGGVSPRWLDRGDHFLAVLKN